MSDFVGTGTIALFYGHVASNIGDLAINRGEVALLRQAFPHATIRVILLSATRSAYLSRSKASFGPAGSVDFVHFRADDKLAPSYVLDARQFLYDCSASDADLIVLSAGEHLFHYAEHENFKNLFWRTLPAFAARQHGRRCLILPSTFGPFESTEAKALMRALFATQPRAAARDAGSAAILAESLPFESPPIALDPAFFLTAPQTRPAAEPVIGLAMRSERWGIRLSKSERDRLVSDTERDGHADSLAFQFGVSFARKTLSAGTCLRLFVQTAADKALSEAIVGEFVDTPDESRIEIVTPRSIEEYLESIATVDGVVASRFHALVLALVAGRPCVGTYFEVHGHKISGLFDLLEQPHLCVGLSQMKLDAAVEVAINGLADASRQAALLTRLEGLRQQTLQWISEEWPAGPAVQGGEQTLEDLRPLSPMAIALMHDAAGRVRVQSKSLGDAEGQVKTLRREVAKLEAGLRAEQERRSETERECAATREALQETREKLRILDRAFKAETAHLNDEIRAARVVIATKDRDLSVVRDTAKRDRRVAIQAAEESARVREALVARVEMLERSESFRIGYAIVRVVTAPVRLLRKLRALNKPTAPHSRSKVRKASLQSADPTPIVSVLAADELEQLYAAGGADAIIAAVFARADADPDPAALGTALIQISRQMIQSGFAEAEYPLVHKAVQLHRSDQTLRAMFWAAQKARKVSEAWRYLTEIEDLYGLNPSLSQARWLERARSGPIMNLVLLDEIVTAGARAFVPRPDRICYVLHNSLPYSSGGYATRGHGLALGLRAVGIEVACITRPGFPFDVKPELEGTTLPSEDLIDDISYLRVWEPRRNAGLLYHYVRGAADAFEARFREIRPALIMAASAYLSALPALIAARRLGLPFIYEVRGFWEITRLSRQPGYDNKPFFHVQKAIEAEIASRADYVFTLTAPMREELVQRGVSAEKISLLPNSCDSDRFTPRHRDAVLAARLGIPADVPVIGYIGTFVQYEGLEDLAAACARLRSRGMVFRLMLVGNEDTSGSGRGRITGEIERIAAEEGLAEWLIMPGRVPHEEVEAYYSLIDIAPFPRKPQPVTEMVSPMKPLEALSMEKAVVVSSVRALTEMVHDEETGLVFEKGSIESLANTLARLISDPELRGRLGRTARAWVARERTWIATATKARDEIKRVIGANEALEQATNPKAGFAAAPEPTISPLGVARRESRKEIFDTVRKMYTARDRARGKVRFSKDDWERTRLVFEMIEGARTIVDIGIGQAQLVNLLARCEDVEKVYGFDFRNYTTRIDPPSVDRYQFRVWNITSPLENPPEPVDVVVVMEVLEHIDVPVVPSVIERLRALSSQGAALITVPYREKEPLYHQGQPHGHKQAFDDARIEELFGPGCLYSNYKQKWYLIFVHESLSRSEGLDLDVFCERVRRMMHHVEIESDLLQASTAIK
jgi:glycosyltransferase involved in cell wall biosynthesis/polysaccharide pyruvyl transferase WcaK-like protein